MSHKRTNLLSKRSKKLRRQKIRKQNLEMLDNLIIDVISLSDHSENELVAHSKKGNQSKINSKSCSKAKKSAKMEGDTNNSMEVETDSLSDFHSCNDNLGDISDGKKTIKKSRNNPSKKPSRDKNTVVKGDSSQYFFDDDSFELVVTKNVGVVDRPRKVKKAKISKRKTKQKTAKGKSTLVRKNNTVLKKESSVNQAVDGNLTTFQFVTNINSCGISVPEKAIRVSVDKKIISQQIDCSGVALPRKFYYISKMQHFLLTQPSSNYFSKLYIDHLIQSFCNYLHCRTSRLTQNIDFNSKKVQLGPLSSPSKKTIVFDLDETLIHCNENPKIPSDITLTIKFPSSPETTQVEVGVNLRPFAREILEELSKDFEIIIFTASHSAYANSVIDKLDPERKWVSSRFFRENCVQTPEGLYIKDLRIFEDRTIENIVIIDNMPSSYGYQIDNGIPIIPFTDNKEDNELHELLPYIKSLRNVSDVRTINRKVFHYDLFERCESYEKMAKLFSEIKLAERELLVQSLDESFSF